MSWSIPSARDCNGKITKYEIAVYQKNGDTRIYLSGEKTLSKDVTGLEANQRFLIGVRAYTKVGPGPYSKNQSYSTGTLKISNVKLENISSHVPNIFGKPREQNR